MRSEKVVKLCGQPFEPHHTLVFVHIPKCGGTSMHRTLETIFGTRYRHLRGRPEDLEGLENVRAIGGHQNFGSTPVHRARTGLVYMTVIRPPAERVLSFHRHVLDHPNHHIRVQMPGIEKASPAEFIEALVAARNDEITNLQTKMLTGRRNLTPQDAIGHVEANFTIVGLLGDENSYVEPLRTLFPRADVRANTLNVSRAQPTMPVRSAALDDLIAETNGKDQILYDHFAARHARARAMTAAGT